MDGDRVRDVLFSSSGQRTAFVEDPGYRFRPWIDQRGSVPFKNQPGEIRDNSDHFLLKIREVYNLHKYNRDYYVFGKGYKPGPECLGKNNLKNRFNSFREMLNMPSEYKLYSWKHTGNSLALDNNISMYALRDQNGHSSVQVTEIYTKNKVGTISRKSRISFRISIICKRTRGQIATGFFKHVQVFN